MYFIILILTNVCLFFNIFSIFYQKRVVFSLRNAFADENAFTREKILYTDCFFLAIVV